MEKGSSVKVVVVVVVVASAIVLTGFVGVRKVQQHNMEQQVMANLAIEDRMARMHAFAHLRDTAGPSTLAVLIQALDDPDPKIHSRAASELALFHETIGSVARPLSAHLQGSPYSDVRLGCAIMLMSVKSPEAHEAYLHALHDSSDKVVEVACMEMPDDAGIGDAEALYAVLDHPTWNVRLEICKALIRMKKADQRVVSALESMRQDPEAVRYDAFIEDSERREKEMGVAGELGPSWGKLDTIIQQARSIAAKRQ